MATAILVCCECAVVRANVLLLLQGIEGSMGWDATEIV